VGLVDAIEGVAGFLSAAHPGESRDPS